MLTYKTNWPKFFIAFCACLLIRIIPFRPPNVEPILATQMPFSKTYGAQAGFLFAFLSIILYDLFTGTLGSWTLITSTTYGVLGIWAAAYFKNRQSTPWNYALFAVLGTLFFDAVTGLSIGPLFFNQPFMQALVGQVPFTLMHLLGNISFALFLSPAIYSFILRNPYLEFPALVKLLPFKNSRS